MNLLAIDTSSSILSVAISSGKNIHYKETDTSMKHSELAVIFINSLMKEADLLPGGLNGVFCMGGPGSFTGLRIGYSIAKGLALSLSIPFAPVPTLDCIAYLDKENENKTLLAVIESRKNACFYAFFKDGIRLTENMEADYSHIAQEIKNYKEQIILTGPSSALFYDFLPSELKENIFLNYKNKGFAKEIIHIAQKCNLLDNDNTEFLYSGPDYIRVSDAEAALMQGK
ncbi:MAG: tRNA (adenosine(37)-N6)-threonylcarbamoyltransferase complex dimerization subunit type 1 TsaB [Treponema sp.]|nr:tRNA (adenosine(37)-N6)-threonylcarbamoyltransferase complex dimerization subunit type 1 TsaB [Treponema sp.]MCL2251191.1 tRNA (adenosine(37)-N6)-threonylcarbamoyltransferase complex dimerization subunit type 1 TsaB [Treponema sp.]